MFRLQAFIRQDDKKDTDGFPVASNVACAQINTERVMTIARNALYFEDYVLSIQYFNQVINAKPYLYEPYFFRGLAKINLDDFQGAEADCNAAIQRNPFVVGAYQNVGWLVFGRIIMTGP